MITSVTAKIIELQIWPQYFEEVLSGNKTFEVREKRDRDFRVGNILLLMCWDPVTKKYDGRSVTKVISYMLDDPSFCLPGHVIMGIKDYENCSNR